MASNTNLGGVFNTDMDGNLGSKTFVSTENVVGLIFDTKIVGGVAAALGTGTLAATTFANGNVVELNVDKDIEAAGIDESVLSGIAKYHLDVFFKLAGDNNRIFVSFMDSTTDSKFDAVEKMQLAANGVIYQIGVWTGEAIATSGDGGTYTVADESILTKLQTVAEKLGGTIGSINYDGNCPVNILVSAPILNAAEVDYKKLPDLTALENPKVSVLVGQPNTEQIHSLMFAVNHVVDSTATFAPVGSVGAALACLAVAPANESIAHVASFNLSAVMQDSELGFGKITENTGKTAYEGTSSFTNIKTLNYSERNRYLHKNGLIFLTNYDGEENSVFFSSDQTLSVGDYRTIARCRVMHKSRRVVRRALLPYVNDDHEIDATKGTLSASTITMFQNAVTNALDANMVEPGTTKPQISGRSCTIDASQNILENDAISIQYALVPKGVSGVISVTEGFKSAI